MTIWVDVTDLMRWGLPQVTGIQRILTAILVPLTRNSTNVRLTHFTNGNSFVPVELDELPPTLTSSCHLREHVGSAPAGSASIKPDKGRRGFRLRPLDWLTHSAPPRVARGVEDYRKASKELRRSLIEWRFKKNGNATTAACEPNPTGANSTERLSAHPFSAGDALLVFGATWGDPRYEQALRAARAHAGVQLVCLVCDLIPTLHPEWVTEDINAKFTSFVRSRLPISDLVLTISQFSRSEALRYCAESGLKVGDIGVIRLGDDLVGYSTAQHGQRATPRFAPSKPFVLCVSTIELRKNHYCLYVAWKKLAAELKDDCPDLVLVGAPYILVDSLMHQMRNDPLVKDRIHILTDVPDSELVWYYSRCLFTVYPSLYEGWGIPVAESLSLGRYCIASNAGSIIELGGNLVDYFDPLDPLTCFKLILRAIQQPDYVSQRERLIRERHKPFPWTSTAKQVLSLVETLSMSEISQSETFGIEAL